MSPHLQLMRNHLYTAELLSAHYIKIFLLKFEALSSGLAEPDLK